MSSDNLSHSENPQTKDNNFKSAADSAASHFFKSYVDTVSSASTTPAASADSSLPKLILTGAEPACLTPTPSSPTATATERPHATATEQPHATPTEVPTIVASDTPVATPIILPVPSLTETPTIPIPTATELPTPTEAPAACFPVGDIPAALPVTGEPTKPADGGKGVIAADKPANLLPSDKCVEDLNGKLVTDSNYPVAGIKMRLLDKNGNPMVDALGHNCIATTKDDGSFAFHGLANGEDCILQVGDDPSNRVEVKITGNTTENLYIGGVVCDSAQATKADLPPGFVKVPGNSIVGCKDPGPTVSDNLSNHSYLPIVDR